MKMHDEKTRISLGPQRSIIAVGPAPKIDGKTGRHIYFVSLAPPTDSEPGYPHYVVVVQSNEVNESDVNTAIVCCLTTTLSRADAPGNVLLAPGEGGMPEQSVVNVSQMLTLDKRRLTDRRAVLDHVRMREVVAGIRLVLEGERGLP